MRKNMLGFLVFFLPGLGLAKTALPVGETLPPLTLSASHGGYVSDGKPWSSESMRGRLNFVVYVDPDDKDLNNALAERLKAENLPSDILSSVALINLAASWKPDSLIMSALRDKQKDYPSTTYVYDKDKSVAGRWQLPPEGYHVLLIDKEGRLLFEKNGQFNKQEIENFLSLVKTEVAKEKAEREKLASKNGKKAL